MGQKRANSGGGSSRSSRSRSRSRNSSSSSGGGGGSSMTKTKTKVKAGGGSTAAGVGAAAALNDERFRLFLQNADEIESIEHFRYWKDEFFRTYRPYLDPLGLATAREADEDLYLQLEKLARVCVDTKTLVKEGKITPERSTVRGQKSVNEMIAATDICEQHIDRYFPKTRDEEALCGYTKFELAAVLVRDGFRIYGLMVATRDYMQGLIGEGGPLAQVLKSNQLSMIRFYFRCLDTFSTTMADLGMFKLMTRCEELYKVRPRCRRRKNNNNNNNNNQKKTKANNSTANNSTANNNKRFDKNGTKDALSDTSEGSGGDFINGGRMFRKSKQKYRAIMNKGWTNGLFKGQQITGPKEQQQQQLPTAAAAAAAKKKKKKKKKEEEEDKKKKKEDNNRDNNRDKDKPKRKSKKKKKNGGHYPCHNHGHNHGHNHNHSNEPQPQDDDVHHESTALGEKENNRGGREGGRGKLDIYMSSQDTSLSSIDIRSLDCTCTADSTLDEHMSSASFTEDEDIFDDDYESESESEEEEVEDPESDTEEEEEDFIYYFDPVRRIVGKVSRKKCLAENLVVGIDPATGAERTEGAIDEWDSKGDQIGKTDLILQLKEILRGQAKDKVDGLD